MSECKQCGECCRYLIVPVAHMPTPENIDYFKTRGVFLAAGHYLWLKLDVKCPYLSATGQCLIHGEHPDLCRKFHCNGDQKSAIYSAITKADPAVILGGA